MKDTQGYYQTVTLVADDGRTFTYSGKVQIDITQPLFLVEARVSEPKPLPADMEFVSGGLWESVGDIARIQMGG